MDEAGLDASYAKHEAVYRRIFSRCGLEFLVVEADSGAMGGTGSQEFMVSTEAGEDLIASCPVCGYAANVEKATSKLESVEDITGDNQIELIETPNQQSIAEVSKFLGVDEKHLVKTLGYMALDEAGKTMPVIVYLRGDHQLNEVKLAAVLGITDVRPMSSEEIQAAFGADAGSVRNLAEFFQKPSTYYMIV